LGFFFYQKFFILLFFQLIPDSVLKELKQCFLEAYDENSDGRIEIGEVCFERFFFFYINSFVF